MSLHRALWLAVPFAMTAALGCNNSSAPPPAATATAEAVKTPAATATATAAPVHKKWRGRLRAGVVGMMFRSAHDLDLKDAQRATIEKLSEQLKADHNGPPAEMKDYHTALVAQVRAGKIDASKLDPLQANIEKAQQARKDKEAESLNALYAALEPAQRKALVAAVRAKQAAHQAKAAEAEGAKHKLDHLTKQLDLDAGQQKKVEALLAKDDHPAADEMKKHADGVLTAFEGDGFDAKKLEMAPGTGKKGMAAHAQFLSALLPLLKPDQREKLAAGMEKTPHGPEGHGPEAPVDESANDEAPSGE